MTIKERADKLYDPEGGSIESIALNNLAKKDYIKGAEDQREIDLKEIYTWLNKNIPHIRFPRYCNKEEYNELLNKWISNFKESMEE